MSRVRHSSTRQPYRRGGVAIGPKGAGTIATLADLGQDAFLKLARDPLVQVEVETESGTWVAMQSGDIEFALGIGAVAGLTIEQVRAQLEAGTLPISEDVRAAMLGKMQGFQSGSEPAERSDGGAPSAGDDAGKASASKATEAADLTATSSSPAEGGTEQAAAAATSDASEQPEATPRPPVARGKISAQPRTTSAPSRSKRAGSKPKADDAKGA